MGYVNPAVACECGHPRGEHRTEKLKPGGVGECLAYDNDPNRRGPWCKCTIFRKTDKVTIAYVEERRLTNYTTMDGRTVIQDFGSIPSKGFPAPTANPLKMAARKWSRYVQQFEPLNENEERIGISFLTDAIAYGKTKYEPVPIPTKSKTALRPSKTARKKGKASKSVVNKLTLTRVPPVTDEEV